MFCSSLSSIPTSLGLLRQLSRLRLAGCDAISALPSSLGNLTQLTFLCLNLTGLTSIPESLSLLTNLIHYDCCNAPILANPVIPSSRLKFLRLELMTLNPDEVHVLVPRPSIEDVRSVIVSLCHCVILVAIVSLRYLVAIVSLRYPGSHCVIVSLSLTYPACHCQALSFSTQPDIPCLSLCKHCRSVLSLTYPACHCASTVVQYSA
jgi:hypothetical protein